MTLKLKNGLSKDSFHVKESAKDEFEDSDDKNLKTQKIQHEMQRNVWDQEKLKQEHEHKMAFKDLCFQALKLAIFLGVLFAVYKFTALAFGVPSSQIITTIFLGTFATAIYDFLKWFLAKKEY